MARILVSFTQLLGSIIQANENNVHNDKNIIGNKIIIIHRGHLALSMYKYKRLASSKHSKEMPITYYYILLYVITYYIIIYNYILLYIT